MRSNNESTSKEIRERRALEGLGNRSIARILERGRARRNRRSYTRAPDFLHGDCRLDAIYKAFGRRWVETTGFVEQLTNSDGEVIGWTVGTFEERFLKIEHVARTELANPDRWLDQKLRGCRRVVALELADGTDGWQLPGDREVLSVGSRQSRLHELEESHLKVTRDRDFDRPAGSPEAMNERFLQSRLNVMSMVCLCARLSS